MSEIDRQTNLGNWTSFLSSGRSRKTCFISKLAYPEEDCPGKLYRPAYVITSSTLHTHANVSICITEHVMRGIGQNFRLKSACYSCLLSLTSENIMP